MTLTLEITCLTGLHHTPTPRLTLEQGALKIGRYPDNDVVLPDNTQMISRYHAEVCCEDGAFLYKDQSANGTELCWEAPVPHSGSLASENGRLVLKNGSVPLADGNRLRIGGYELWVHINIDAGMATGPKEDADATRFVVAPSIKEPAQVNEAHLGMVCQPPDNVGEPNPPDEFLKRLQERFGNSSRPGCGVSGPAPPSSAEGEPVLGRVDTSLPVEGDSTVYQFGDAVPSYPNGEQACQPLEPKPSAPPIADPPSPKPLEPSMDGALLERFLTGAGLSEFEIKSHDEQLEMFHIIGLIYREMTLGIMDVLRGRTDEKREIGAEVTSIQRDRNNPLKSFPRAELAMKVMLARRHEGYMDPVQAVQQGFADIKSHQMAMRAAMRAWMNNVLEKFDPASFEAAQAEAGMFQSKKAKCWEAYQESYPRLVRAALDDTPREVLVRAYEQQIDRLNNNAKR